MNTGSNEEYEKMFGSFFLEERTLEGLNGNDILSCFDEDERDNIKKKNWRAVCRKNLKKTGRKNTPIF